jgi:hypothetical protein
MERKLLGVLLTAVGIVALILADVNLMRAISDQGYTNNLYDTGDKGSAGLAVMGYGLGGLICIFLGIKKLSRRASV